MCKINKYCKSFKLVLLLISFSFIMGELFMVNNLTVGTPFKVLLKFMIPIYLGGLLQQLYSVADMAIIGQFIGLDALAGVGAVSSLNFLILGFVFGTSTGLGIPISKAFGANDTGKIKKYFATSLCIAVVTGLILTIVLLVFTEQILSVLQIPDNAYPHSKDYIFTFFAGLIGMFIYNLLASVLRAVGNSKTPLYFLFLSSALNVVLDLIFVLVFHMGVFGTSLATVISQSFSALLCILLILKKYEILKITLKDLRVKQKDVTHLIFVSFPMGLQFSITAIGSVVLQSAVNSLGTVAIAAVAAGSRVHAVILKGFEAIGVSMASFCGQNLGAKKLERISVGVRHSFFIGLVYWIASFILLATCSRYFAMLFISPTETATIDATYTYLFVSAVGYIFLLLLHIFRNTVQALGYTTLAMLTGVFELVARVVVSITLVANFGFMGAVFANPIAWISAISFLIPVYIYIMRKFKRDLKKQS